jgi:hypothetical protein
MSIIPIDVQRRCERRWAARFSRQGQQIAAPDKSKRKTHRGEAAGLAATEARLLFSARRSRAVIPESG